MAQTTTDTETRNPPAEAKEQKEPREQKALPASDKDLRWRKFQKTNPRWRMALVIAGLVVLVGVFFLWRYFGSYESTDDAQIDGHLNPISARISGHVAKLLVEDNQYVEAGTPLLQIDPKDYQVAVDRARANYADAVAQAQGARVNVPITSVGASSQESSAQAEVENTRSGIAGARQQYESAKAQQAQAEANNVKAQNDLIRYKQLVDKQEISQQQYDQAVANAKASAATVAAAEAGAAAAQQQISQAQSKLAQAQAGVRSASTAPQQVAVQQSRARSAEANADRMKAELEEAELNLEYTTIDAPVSGVVTNRTVEVGQNVVQGQELMKIVPLDDIWVTANFKENQLNKVRPGQPVTISVDAFDKKYKGHVQSVSGTSGAVSSLLPPENATGNYVKVVQRVPVKITFDPGETKEHILRPGMSVEPKVSVQ